MKQRLSVLLLIATLILTGWSVPTHADSADDPPGELVIPQDWRLLAEDHFDVTENIKANLYTGGTGFEGSWCADYACTKNTDDDFLAQGKKAHTVPELLPIRENDPNYVLTRWVSSGEMTQFRKMSEKIDLSADGEYYLMFDFYNHQDANGTTIRLGLRDSGNESANISFGTQAFPPAGKMIPTILTSKWQVGNADTNPLFQQPSKAVPVNDLYTAVVQISARASDSDIIRFRIFYDTEKEEAPSFFPSYWTTQYAYNGSQNNLDTLEFFTNVGSGGSYSVTLDDILLYKGAMVSARPDTGSLTALTAGRTVTVSIPPANIAKHPQVIESVNWYDNTMPGVLFDPIGTGETFTIPADMTGRSLLAEVTIRDTETNQTTVCHPVNQYIRHDLEIIALTIGSRDGKGGADISKLDTVSELAVRADVTRNNGALTAGWVKMALIQYDELGQQKQIYEPAPGDSKNGNQPANNIPYNGARRMTVRFQPVQNGTPNFTPGDTFRVLVGYIPEKNADGSANSMDTPITDTRIVQPVPYAETSSDSQLRQDEIKVPGGTQAILPETWRSALYPEDWTPGYQDEDGHFLHDFSYAGYHRGEKPLPEIKTDGLDASGDTPLTRVYNAVEQFRADPTGKTDATKAIQAAIDTAGDAGGGIVYLPAGTYAITQAEGTAGGYPYCLLMQKSNVVLKGDGPDKTHLFINQTNVRSLHTVYMGSGSWYYPLSGTERKITQDLMKPTKTIPVESTEGYSAGDWIIVGTARKVSDEFAAEHGLGPGSHGGRNWTVTDTGSGVDSPVFYRQITDIDRENNIITIDSPTRYYIKTRDGARIYKITPHTEELGIQDLSFGNLENLKPGLGETEYNAPGTGAYEMHDSYFIMTQNIVNSWIKNVTSYRPAANTRDYHMASNALWVHESKGLTIENCRFEKALYQGGAGNGYAFAIGGNDGLYKNCSAGANRHNYSFRQMSTSGNVLLNCVSQPSKYVDDFHQHLSMANLIDGHEMNDVRFDAVFRSYGTVLHGQVTAESVFWNCNGGQVRTQQFGNGYAIGCSNVSAEIGSSDFSKPMDYVEGTGKGAGLVPSSLYLDQLTRRLQNNQGYLPYIRFANEENKDITDGFSDTDRQVKVKAVASFDPGQNPQSPALIAILFKKADSGIEGTPDEVIEVQQDKTAENSVFETGCFDFSAVDDIGQYYIKVFLWDSMDNMSPLLSTPILYDRTGIHP